MAKRRRRFLHATADPVSHMPMWLLMLLIVVAGAWFDASWFSMGEHFHDAPAQPEVSGTPEEIVAQWNRESYGLPLSAAGTALRERLVRHVTDLQLALDRKDAKAAELARGRIAEVFQELRALGLNQGPH